MELQQVIQARQGADGAFRKPRSGIIGSNSEFHGVKTNNQAEMAALIQGINESLKWGLKRIIFEEDSKLTIDHLNRLNKNTSWKPNGSRNDRIDPRH